MYLAKNAGFHSYLYISVTEFNSLWLKRSNRTQEVFYWKHFLGTVYLVDLSNTLTYVIIFEVSVKVVLHRFSAGWSADWGDPSVASSQRMCNPIMSEQRNLSREITVWPGLLNGLWPFPSSHKCAIATLAQRKKLQAVRVVRGSYKLLQGVRNTEVFLFFSLLFVLFNYEYTFIIFIFWLYHVACGILSSPTSDQIHTPSIEARSLNRWTTREVPWNYIYLLFIYAHFKNAKTSEYSIKKDLHLLILHYQFPSPQVNFFFK